jgi:serine/threonine protein kinase
MSHANHHNREKHKQNTSKGKRRTADNHHRPSPRVDELSADNEHKVVGQYLVGKTIGEGTFGKVKLAIHIPTGEKVTVFKVINTVEHNICSFF